MEPSHIYTVPQDISTGAIVTRIRNLQTPKRTKRNQPEEKASLFLFLQTAITRPIIREQEKRTGDEHKRHKGTTYNSKHNNRTAENTTEVSPRAIGV